MIESLERQFSVDLGAFVREEGEEVFAEPFFEFLGATCGIPAALITAL